MSYRVVFHLDADNTDIFALGLGNAGNLLKAAQGTECDIVLLFNGPAVRLLDGARCTRADSVRALQEQGVRFRVCSNAMRSFGGDIEALVPGCEPVPAGVMKLILLQQKGYAYIKP